MIYNSIEEMIGNTPLLKIKPEIHGLKNIDLYAKLEYYNPFGSVKDRIAYNMFKPLKDDLVSKGKQLVESSSGNTAKALAALCGLNGVPFKAITNRIKYPEVREVLLAMGAEVQELPGLSDCPDPHDPNDAIQYSRDLANKNPGEILCTDQYFNELNIQAHTDSTGPELTRDLGSVDYFFSFLGTCGTSMGTGNHLRAVNPATRIYGIVADAGHKIPGGRNVEELWEVGFFRRDYFTDLLSGDSAQAVEGMLELNRRSGVLAGPTSGLVYLAAINKLRELDEEAGLEGRRAKAVFIACDRMEPYMSFLRKHRPSLFAQRTTARETVNSLTPEMVAEARPLPARKVEEIVAGGAFVIDIRGHFAFSIGHVPGSINILDDYFASTIESGHVFPKDKDILVICRVGDISRRYAAYLQRQGYRAWSLEGGYQAYKQAGLATGKLEKNEDRLAA